MLRSRYSQVFFLLIATVASTVMFRSLASAETSPGTAEVNSSDSVTVTGSDTSNVDVTTSNQSSTTVGSSSDGTAITPLTTQSQNSTTVGSSSDSTNISMPSENSTQQNDQGSTLSAQSAKVGSDADQSGNVVSTANNIENSLVRVSRFEDLLPMATNAKSDNSVPLQAPISSDKNLPAPVSQSGSVLNAFSGSGSGFGGKGLAIIGTSLAQLNASRVLIIVMALLMIITSSFISFLRRSGFSHAPRSDDSMADTYSFDTPRVEIPVLFGLRTAPVFYVASRLQLTFQLEGR